MIASLPAPPRVILYEGPGATPFAPEDRGRLVAALLDRGYAVSRAGATAAGGAVTVTRCSALSHGSTRHSSDPVVDGQHTSAPAALGAQAKMSALTAAGEAPQSDTAVTLPVGWVSR